MKIFIVFILFLVSINVVAQENYGIIDLDDDDFTEFDVFGDTLDDFTVYFTGENHNYATFNTKLEFKLLRYLYETQDVKHFVFEQSPGVGSLLNG